MKFKKGKDWTGNRNGRPKGSQNRSTEMQKINLQRAINESLDFLKEDLQKIRKEDPAKAVTLLLKMLEYSIPKLKSVEITGELDHRISEIKVSINQPNSDNKEVK